MRRGVLALVVVLAAVLMFANVPSTGGRAATPPKFGGGSLVPPPYQPSALNNDFEPGMGVDGDGNFWIGGNPSGRNDIRYVEANVFLGEDVWKSTDGGRTYQWAASPFSTVSPNTPGFGGGDADLAVAGEKNAAGCYNVYAASLWV